MPSTSTPSLGSVCCQWPPGFSFEDQRDTSGHGHVIDSKTQAKYGIAGETDKQLRLKCLGLFLGTQAVFNGGYRLLHRVKDLLCGDFVYAGNHLALKELRVEYARKSNAVKNTLITPSHEEVRNVKIKHTLWQLIKNIVKLVTYPLAIVGMQLAALYGIFNPHSGRALYAMIEDAWAHEVLSPELVSTFQIRCSDYLVPCMQPKEVVEKHDLMRLIVHPGKYHPDTLRSIVSHIHRKLNAESEFYANVGVDVDGLRKTMQSCKARLKAVGRKDYSEFSGVHLKQSENETQLGKELKSVLFALNDIEETWNRAIEYQNSNREFAHAALKGNMETIVQKLTELNTLIPRWKPR